jgi:hypothetical protein
MIVQGFFLKGPAHAISYISPLGRPKGNPAYPL